MLIILWSLSVCAHVCAHPCRCLELMLAIFLDCSTWFIGPGFLTESWVQNLPVPANQANKLASGRPCLCLLRFGIKGDCHTLLAFSWVLGILTLALTLAWQVPYPENHLPSSWLFTWTLVGTKLRYSYVHSRRLTDSSISPASVNSFFWSTCDDWTFTGYVHCFLKSRSRMGKLTFVEGPREYGV